MAAAAFTEEEKAVDDALGYPRAYARLCRGGGAPLPYCHGPPHAFLPYALQPHEALRARDLNEMFPVTDAEALPAANPRGFANLLWKQLDHLGNAGFDPALFRVDPYGNVLYLHADSASPLAWDVDHWFPCARGGKTVPSNLRVVQAQVCRRKHGKLEFLVPWWDLQLGISVNHFLSIFASKNADFRNRAFTFLFADGAGEELSSLQAVEAHAFPQHFSETKRKVGLAPAAIVSSRGSDNSVLKSIDANRPLRSNYPLIAAKKFTGEKDEISAVYSSSSTKENTNPADGYSSNPYLSIAMARDSLRQRDESRKKQAEAAELEHEVAELQQRNEEERVAIQDLEAQLIKRRRRAEKCRSLAEAQSNYKAVLEKMIRDAMHQYVVHKEQLRLNQAATSTLMARLEAQRAMCDSSETELRKKYHQKEDLETQVRPFAADQARKRYRVDDGAPAEERRVESAMRRRLPGRRTTRSSSPLKQELRAFLELDQRTADAYVSLEEDEDEAGEEVSESDHAKHEPSSKVISFPRRSQEHHTFRSERGRSSVREKLEKRRSARLAGDDDKGKSAAMIESEYESEMSRARQAASTLPRASPALPPYRAHGAYGMLPRYPTEESMVPPKIDALRRPRADRSEADEKMNLVGRGNVEWLHMLTEEEEEGPALEDSLEGRRIPEEDASDEQQNGESCRGDEITELVYSGEIVDAGGESSARDGAAAAACRKSFDVKEEKKVWFPRSDSGRGFRSLPSSPSKILGTIRGGVECMKPKVAAAGDDGFRYDHEDSSVSSGSSKFLIKCRQAIKRAVHK